MNITIRTSTKGATMNSARKSALYGGLFYLLSFVSIPTLALYGAVRGANFIVGPGPDAPAASAPTAGSSGDSSAAATCIWACLRIGQQRRIHRGRGIGAIDLARSATAVAGQHRKSRQGDEAK